MLIDYDQTGKSNIFGTSGGGGSGVKTNGTSINYKELGPDGSPIVMNLEMNAAVSGVSVGESSCLGGKNKSSGGKSNTKKKQNKNGNKK